MLKLILISVFLSNFFCISNVESLELGPFYGGADDGKISSSSSCHLPLSSFSASQTVYPVRVNDAFYAVGNYCGACINITSDSSWIEGMIVDKCWSASKCPSSGDLILNKYAWDVLFDLTQGKKKKSNRARSPVTWKVIECSWNGNLKYRVSKSSNEWWLSFLIWNHNVEISSVEIRQANTTTWLTCQRTWWNEWVFSNSQRIRG